MNEIKPRFLTEKDVAKMVGKSVAWLQRKRWEGGGIPYRKIGRSVRYTETDIMNWLDEKAKTYTSTSEYTKDAYCAQ